MSWSATLKNRQQIRAALEAGEEIAVMFSDIRGFTSYTAQRGDRAAYRLTQTHESLLKERIEERGGIVVKTLGDGVMAAFAEPVQGIQAARAIQEAIRAHNTGTPDDPIAVGIGLAGGSPVMTENDLIGHTVNLAQRISSLAKGGQILVDERVRDLSPLDEGLQYLFLGERDLKGAGQAAVYEVAWLGEVARLSDARDRLTLVLTERGTLVVEFEKGGEGEAGPEGRGIVREHGIPDVELALEGRDLVGRLGKKGFRLTDFDPRAAAAFLSALADVRTHGAKPRPSAAGR